MCGRHDRLLNLLALEEKALKRENVTCKPLKTYLHCLQNAFLQTQHAMPCNVFGCSCCTCLGTSSASLWGGSLLRSLPAVLAVFCRKTIDTKTSNNNWT